MVSLSKRTAMNNKTKLYNIFKNVLYASLQNYGSTNFDVDRFSSGHETW